jgi:hypothetical protein
MMMFGRMSNVFACDDFLTTLSRFFSSEGFERQELVLEVDVSTLYSVATLEVVNKLIKLSRLSRFIDGYRRAQSAGGIMTSAIRE